MKGYAMRQKTGPSGLADRHVREVKRQTQRKFSAEEKIRIVLDTPTALALIDGGHKSRSRPWALLRDTLGTHRERKLQETPGI
jgi:hypothetical protein